MQILKIKYILLFLLGGLAKTILGQKAEQEIKQNFKTDITFLASDQLKGRLAGSEQDRQSANYIAAQFKAAGLKPYNNIELQPFNIIKFRIATNKSKFEFHFPSADSTLKTELVLFRDYFPLSESGMNDSAYAAPVHCGYGIEAPGLGINSYQNLNDLKGKIFVIILGFPGDDTAVHSPLAAFADISSKIKSAMAHGASGIIFTVGSPKAEKPVGELQRNAVTYPLPIVFLDKEFYPRFNMLIKLKTVVGAPGGNAYNVLGYRNNHKKNTVIICAHHDHLGFNEYGNSLYTGPQAVHNGADDNASGVAAMLQLARSLKGKKYKKNNYLFIAFSGEEMGLLGSKYFLQQKIIPNASINYVINIDMLGRTDSVRKILLVNGTGTSVVWAKSLNTIKTDSNQVKLVTSASGLGPSDHASFYLEGIPVLHFFSGQHADYHKPSDDEDKINYHGMYVAYQTILKIVSATNKSGKLPFTKTIDNQPGSRTFKVTLGLMPDYAFTGAGMRVDGVSDGKPAQKAGVLRGDIITKLGDFSVANVQDYMKALQNFEKGEKITVQILRNGEIKNIEVTL